MTLVLNSANKYYAAEPKTNPKDRVQVEVGDSKDATTFHPQVKVMRWNNEVNTSIRLKHDNITGNVSYSDDGTKITWQKGQWKAVFYERADVDDGGFEFEIHIPKKPPRNYLEFTVNTKDLDWFYQPALTQEEIDRGSSRPDNVVGSYAVYHKTKGGMNDAAGMEYKTGKAFHVYRPHVVDAAGKETWGTFSLDEANGVLTLTVDQTWLNNASYPVIVDPTFGYTSQGASTADIYKNTSFADTAYIEGCDYTLSAGGTVSKLTVSVAALPASYTDCTVYGGIFASGTTEPFERNGESVSQTGITSTGWKDLTYSTGPTLSAGDHKLCCYADCDGAGNYNTLTIHYDASGGTNSVQRLGSGAPGVSSMANTLTTTGNGNGPVYCYISSTQGTRKPSIYATYTEGGGTETLPPPQIITWGFAVGLLIKTFTNAFALYHTLFSARLNINNHRHQ